MLFFFFFQAEDGIRDSSVTGVQTCALPISGIREGGGVTEQPGVDREALVQLAGAGGATLVGLEGEPPGVEGAQTDRHERTTLADPVDRTDPGGEVPGSVA